MLTIVACGTTTTEVTTTMEPNTATGGYTLPDLSGKNKTEIETIFSYSGGVIYNFVYEQNSELSEDSFIRYGGDLTAGTIVATGPHNPPVEIVIATPDLVLPDLEGKNQFEVISILRSLNIKYVTPFEIIEDDDVLDQTFSKYGDDLEAGDTIDKDFSVTVYIGLNTIKLPDLTGKIKEEIRFILNQENILYEFEYVINDDYPEDQFIEYKDYEIGDSYQEDTVVIKLYKNTFTENETSLIISKYVDGGIGTFNQAIEIYNPTNDAIDLKDYSLAIYSNGSYEISYQIDFEDEIIEPEGVYIIVNSNSTIPEMMRKADILTADLVFDGNDTIQLLYKNGTYIDTIYDIGNQSIQFSEEIFIRNENVVVGTRKFISDQWEAYIPTFTEVLGTHPYNGADYMTFTLIPRSFYDLNGGMVSVTLDRVNDGDTASFEPGFMDNSRVRFIGVNTPETYPTVPVSNPWGEEAKAYTSTILLYAKNNGKPIYIQSDPKIGYRDTYDRHLGLVWVDLGDDVLSIDILDSNGNLVYVEQLTGLILLNYQIIKNGFSLNKYSDESELIFDNKYLYRWMEEAERFAKENNLGLHE
jgi:endonuclease YncB( thermonuclease family)/beta-lactam-binding protein with PASTA domain